MSRYVDSKERVARLLAEGHNQAHVARALGLTESTVAYHARTLGRPADSRYGGRWNLKRRLLADRLEEPHCERWGIDAWRGEPLPLALHHVDGDNRDDRLANLGLLCPNCHSQTDNFAGRNRRAAVAMAA